MSQPKTDELHAHLDVCRQCADHPFNLCSVGAAKLKAASQEAVNWMAGQPNKTGAKQ